QSNNVDRTPADIYAMPNYYNNVASKCDGHGHRIFVTSNKSSAPSNLVVINDASCPGGGGWGLASPAARRALRPAEVLGNKAVITWGNACARGQNGRWPWPLVCSR